MATGQDLEVIRVNVGPKSQAGDAVVHLNPMMKLETFSYY